MKYNPTTKIFAGLCLVSFSFMIITLIVYPSDTLAPRSQTFSVYTIGCKIPNFDPYDPTVRDLVNRSEMVIHCNATLPMTFTDGHVLRINRTALNLHYNERLDYCTYETIYRPTEELSDNIFRYSRAIQFTDDVVVGRSEFVRVACFGHEGNLMYTNFHAFMFKKDDVERKRRRKHKNFLKKKKPLEVFLIIIII